MSLVEPIYQELSLWIHEEEYSCHQQERGISDGDHGRIGNVHQYDWDQSHTEDQLHHEHHLRVYPATSDLFTSHLLYQDRCRRLNRMESKYSCPMNRMNLFAPTKLPVSQKMRLHLTWLKESRDYRKRECGKVDLKYPYHSTKHQLLSEHFGVKDVSVEFESTMKTPDKCKQESLRRCWNLHMDHWLYSDSLDHECMF